MNKKIAVVLLCAFFCGACLCKTTARTVAVPAETPLFSDDMSVAEEPQDALEQEQTQGPQVQPQSQSQPHAQSLKAAAPKVTAKKPAAAAEQVAAQAPAAGVDTSKDEPPFEEVPAVPTDEAPTENAFTEQDAARLIAADRARQTLTTPVPDNGVFDKEPLIPLEDRLLSPLAYEPLRPDTSSAQWRGEQLKFGVYYSFIKAGTAYIRNRGLTEVNGRKAFLIQTSAFSASVIDSVFSVRDINYSWIDAETSKSLGYTQSLREGNYIRDEWLTFDIENHRYYGEVQKKEEPRVIVGTLDEEVLDMLSSLYYVRTQPLEVGKDIVFDIVNREKQYPLVVKVQKQETIKTAAGKFNCWVVEPKFRGEGIFVAKGKSLKVWLTADEYKMPVKMQAEVFIGSVKAELLEYRRN